MVSSGIIRNIVAKLAIYSIYILVMMSYLLLIYVVLALPDKYTDTCCCTRYIKRCQCINYHSINYKHRVTNYTYTVNDYSVSMMASNSVVTPSTTDTSFKLYYTNLNNKLDKLRIFNYSQVHIKHVLRYLMIELDILLYSNILESYLSTYSLFRSLYKLEVPYIWINRKYLISSVTTQYNDFYCGLYRSNATAHRKHSEYSDFTSFIPHLMSYKKRKLRSSRNILPSKHLYTLRFVINEEDIKSTPILFMFKYKPKQNTSKLRFQDKFPTFYSFLVSLLSKHIGLVVVHLRRYITVLINSIFNTNYNTDISFYDVLSIDALQVRAIASSWIPSPHKKTLQSEVMQLQHILIVNMTS